MFQHKNSRRDFLKKSLLGSASLLIPSFLKAFESPNIINNNSAKTLIVVQLSGGNDGLNTVVPFRNDIYYKNRPIIGIKPNQVLKLNDELGLHPAMSGLKSLYDNGELSIVNNVGYPNPNRSHFHSMDIWHTAGNPDRTVGWLGRYLDNNCSGCDDAYHALEVDDSLNLALKGIERSGFAAGNLNQLKRTTNNRFFKTLAAQQNHHSDENIAYLYKTMRTTMSSADYLHKQSKIYTSKVQFPNTAFGKDLKQISELIAANTDTKIYYVTLNGFDTHANQKGKHERLLKQYSNGMKALVKDLKQHGRFDDTLIMTFSEFGRRVKQNGSQGTDHGTASNVYLIGGKLRKAGVFNEAPNLTDLDGGDLKFTLDFRQIYSTVLDKWLEADATAILGQQYKTLGIV